MFCGLEYERLQYTAKKLTETHAILFDGYADLEYQEPNKLWLS
jgi:hypothetical protein